MIRISHSFWGKACLNCGNRFSFLDDAKRSHDFSGTRISTCKKCGTKHYERFRGGISLTHPVCGDERPAFYHEHKSSMFRKDRIVLHVLMAISIFVYFLSNVRQFYIK